MRLLPLLTAQVCDQNMYHKKIILKFFDKLIVDTNNFQSTKKSDSSGA